MSGKDGDEVMTMFFQDFLMFSFYNSYRIVNNLTVCVYSEIKITGSYFSYDIRCESVTIYSANKWQPFSSPEPMILLVCTRD